MIALSDTLGKNCLLIIVFVACCIISGFLIGHAIKKKRQIDREVYGTHMMEDQKVERVASELSEQATKLQRGFRRISESRDPLKAFIDALSERQDVIDRRGNQ